MKAQNSRAESFFSNSQHPNFTSICTNVQCALLLKKLQARSALQSRVSSRMHDGIGAVAEQNQRWCSDGFEIANNGQVVKCIHEGLLRSRKHCVAHLG
jgi:hypothetical protein